MFISNQIAKYQKNGDIDWIKNPKFYNDLQNEQPLKELYKMEIDCLRIADCSQVCPLPDIFTSTTEKPNTETTATSDENDK